MKTPKHSTKQDSLFSPHELVRSCYEKRKTLQYLLIVAAILCPGLGFSQPAVGTTWFYNDYFQYPLVNSATIQADKDTTINGKTCLRLISTGHVSCAAVQSDYIYQEDNQVYYWDNENNQFHLLYDYKLNTGESYSLFANGAHKNILVHIDSVGSFNFSGRTLRVQYLSSEDLTVDVRGNTIQDIGNSVNFFFNLGACDPNYMRDLRCYQKGDSLAKLSTVDCETNYYDGIDENNLIQNQLSAYPNPTNDLVKIHATFNEQIDYCLTNMVGETVQMGNCAASELSLTISQQPKGIYLLQVSSPNRQQSIRIVKQ